jgi:hypothetical protein
VDGTVLDVWVPRGQPSSRVGFLSFFIRPGGSMGDFGGLDDDNKLLLRRNSGSGCLCLWSVGEY